MLTSMPGHAPCLTVQHPIKWVPHSCDWRKAGIVTPAKNQVKGAGGGGRLRIHP